MFSAESSLKPARLSAPSGMGLTPPVRVEKALAKPSRSRDSHARARTAPPSRHEKPAAVSSVSVIVSIGIDIIEVGRVRQALERTPRMRARVFTEGERAYCEGRGAASAQHFAARFAAKEAALKALGTGWRGRIKWHDVEVIRQETGEPALLLHGEAREIFRRSGATLAHLSMSHTSEHAVAQVILEKIG
jgi:holo-[acyl-carrier protein] synthase